MDRKSNDSSRSLIGKYGGERERERERRKTEKIFALGRLFCRRLGSRLAATPSCLWNYLRLTSPFLKKKNSLPIDTGDQHPPGCAGRGQGQLEGRARQGRGGLGCRRGPQGVGRRGGDGGLSWPSSCLEKSPAPSSETAHFL